MIQFDSSLFPKTAGVYIVGGSVRDLLLDRSPTDYDIAVSENPEQLAKKMAATTKGRLVKMGKPGQMIFRVVSSDHIFDITSLNGESIADDLNKRDFTINAMAFDLKSGKIIDCLGGIKDLADKKIRMVSRDVFKKDPVRLIRAYRIGACLDFEIEPHTVSAIRNQSIQIQNSAPERVRAEFFKMLGSPKSHTFLSQMADTQLLTTIFPELGALKGCLQNRHHHFDVFEHTMRAYLHLETILNDVRKFLPETTGHISEWIDEDRASGLKCAMLLHDIGKPLKRTVGANGNAHFFGHSRKSADMALKIGNRLRFSTREKRFIDFIIRNHIRPLSLFLAHQNNTLTSKGKTRFFMKCGPDTAYLLLHAMADFMGKKDDHEQKKDVAFTSFLKGLIQAFFSDFKPRSNEPPLITGDDLVDEFGLTPSPLFKKLLSRVKEAKLANRVQNRKEALKLVKEMLNRRA
ncbi:CCA tRNA nucleotidyltransferase [Thermodesulfobacteriota bacterium]